MSPQIDCGVLGFSFILNTSLVGLPIISRTADYCVCYHMALLKVIINPLSHSLSSFPVFYQEN